MADIITLLKQNYNPFDLTTARSGNFWLEKQPPDLTVESIHHQQLNEIVQLINQVQISHITRTILLKGDLASGKSYFLGRLKKTINQKALFAYIGSWSDNDYIWRHILRQTVDSLMQTPENESQSQFLLWLNSLSAFQDKSLTKRIFGEKTVFVQNFKSSYPTGIYQSKNFFSALYHATQPDDYVLACDWLRGEDLDASDLKQLGIRKSLSSEEDAKNILMNLGRVSAKAQYPIVLCFDQVDQACLKENGLATLLGVNTTIHNEKLQNFVIILSLIQSTWETQQTKQLLADKDRLDLTVQLQQITLDQAEEIWQKRLHSFHKQANPKPNSNIAPLTRAKLENAFPTGRTVPRYVIQLGHQLIQKLKGHQDINPKDSFSLVWDKEFKKIQGKVERIRQQSSGELAQYLADVLKMLGVADVNYKYMEGSKYSSYSLSFTHPKTSRKTGILWNEDPNMLSFCYSMKACKKMVENNSSDTIIFIRNESFGSTKNKGYKLFQKIFSGNPHRHICPHLDSVHYLVTYHRLLNEATSGELVIGYDSPKPEHLKELVKQSGVFEQCQLLKKLEIIDKPVSKGQMTDSSHRKPDIKIREFLMKQIQNQGLLGAEVLINSTLAEFDAIALEDVTKQLKALQRENYIRMIGDKKNIKDQSVFRVPEDQRQAS
jgi:hypothetical protein